MIISVVKVPDLLKYGKQINYALSRTLNDIGFQSKKALEGELSGGLGGRAAVSKAYLVDKSTKTNLITTIRMKGDWHRHVLEHHYKGGTGDMIDFEQQMISRGYMTTRHSAIPTKKMGKAMYNKIKNSTTRGGRGSGYFVVPTRNPKPKTKHLQPGVYKRLKKKSKPVILFTDLAKYRKRFDMKKTISKVVDRRFERKFHDWLNKSIK